MKKTLSYTFFVAMLFATTTALAKTVNLYLEPKAGSKLVSTLNTNAGITIVYSPKSGEWVKVANPANGDVGWVKYRDLGSNAYNMRIITSDNGKHSFRVYQFSTGANSYNPQQLEKEMRQFEQQQRMMQAQMAHVFNDMVYFPQPIFIPVVVPMQAKLQNKQKLPQAVQKIQHAN